MIPGWIAKGLQTAEIREKAGLSSQQMHPRLQRVRRRAGVKTLEAIARWAFENALDVRVED